MKLYLNLLMRLATLLAAGLMSLSVYASPVGVWSESPAGLPYCRYDGNEADLRFIHGNYRMNVLAHSDGAYEIISGERVWTRFNADPDMPDHGRNRATLSMGRKDIQLVGFGSKKSKNRYDVYTGIGFTRYDYNLKGGIKCSRMISVLPSDEVNKGTSCFVITITLTNVSGGAKEISYEEAFSPLFMPVADQLVPAADRAFNYQMATEITFRCLKGYFLPVSNRFMHMPSPAARFRHEVAPQSVFLYSPDAFLSISEGEFKAQFFDMKLKAGEKRVLNVVVGLTMGDDAKTLAESVLSKAGNGQFGLFEDQWKRKLPNFSVEKNRSVRRDMYMNSYSLESAAVYDGYFDETFVPCESGDVYHSGANLSNSDHLQRALPLCYTNPELAKSSLKYVLKHASYDGRIYGGNVGYGHVPSSCISGYYDAVLYLFQLLGEYLRITGDYAFLDETVMIYTGDYIKVLPLLERCFIFMRDEIPAEADKVSVLKNLSLASSFLPDFADQMKESEKASVDFVNALTEYADWAWDAFRKSDGYLDDEANLNEESLALYNYLRALE